MSIINKIIAFVLLVGSMEASAQNLSEAFAKSYAAEKSGNYTEAINALNGTSNTSVYEVNLRLGWLYYANKNHKESLGYYQKAISLKPMATEPLWGIIYPLSSLDNWVAVEQAYKDILKLDPKNSKANYYLGSIYFYRKDYKSAKAFLTEVVALFPFDREALILLAWSQYYLGNKAEAKKLFEHVLNNKPDDSSALEGLSLLK